MSILVTALDAALPSHATPVDGDDDRIRGVGLTMLPDTGERYLTTPLFAELPEDMDADEVALSQSTPDFRWAEAATGALTASRT